MNASLWVMLALYLLGAALWITALVRVQGDHWRTASRWLAAGWAAYLAGVIFAVAGTQQ